MQSSGLTSVVPFVPFGCFSRSFLPPFHRHFTAQKNKAVQPKAGQPHFSAVRSSSSHVLFLRSVGLMHPQYRPAVKSGTVLCLPPSVFSAVAPSHSHRGWLRFPHFNFSETLGFYSQISSLQSLLIRSLCPKSRYPATAGDLSFFPAVSRCYPFSPLSKLRSVLGLAWLFDCRNPATALLIHSAIIPLALHFSSIPCGTWGC